MMTQKQQITATVSNITIEAGLLGSGWVVEAQWQDPRTRQVHTFRSRRQGRRPMQHPGESVIVELDSADQTRYRMLL